MTKSVISSTEMTDPQFPLISEAEIIVKRDLLASVFKKIYTERMNDVPIINEKLAITTIGFQQWQSSILGILITPWFMNIILLPSNTENWDDIPELSAKTHHFPSGQYKFLMGYEPGIGRYQMCSLFSPMFEFADNNAAVETGNYAIHELMNIKNVEKNDIDAKQIEQIWNNDEPQPEDAKEDSMDSSSSLTKASKINKTIEQPISRRDLLRGAFLKDGSTS